MKRTNEKFEHKDRKRDKDGVHAKRRKARRAKQNRRRFERGDYK